MRTEVVSTLERNATELISEISIDHQPVLITQHGLPAAYLVDVETYETMETRILILEGLERGEKAIREGETLTHEEAKVRWATWLD